MSEQDNAQVGVETTETVETLTAKLEAEAKARAKAEAKIVDMKKSTTPEVKEEVKEEVTEAKWLDMETYKSLRAEEKFFDENADLLEYKDKLSEKVKMGNTWEEAKLLVENSDETIRNRKVASQTNFTSGDAPDGVRTYSQEALYKLDPAAKRRALEDIASWKAKEVI